MKKTISGIDMPEEKDILKMSKKMDMKDMKMKLPKGKSEVLPKDIDKKVKELF